MWQRARCTVASPHPADSQWRRFPLYEDADGLVVAAHFKVVGGRVWVDAEVAVPESNSRLARLDRYGRYIARLAARVVELRRMARYLAVEAEVKAQARHDRLLRLLNDYRAEHGDPPMTPIVADWDGTGEWTEAYGVLAYSTPGGVLQLGSIDGPAPWHYNHPDSVAQRLAPESGAPYTPPGAAPGTNGED